MRQQRHQPLKKLRVGVKSDDPKRYVVPLSRSTATILEVPLRKTLWHIFWRLTSGAQTHPSNGM